MKTSSRISTQQLVLCAIFVALITVCAWISIPIGSVPVTLQLLAVLLCASLLKPAYSLMTVVAYALLGLIGAPVFSGMTGGAAKLFGLTGGYIIGFMATALVTGGLIRLWGRAIWKQIIAMLLGVAVCYVFGTAWFMILDNGSRSLSVVMGLCVIPFIPFDIIKTIIAAILANRLYEPMKRILSDL